MYGRLFQTNSREVEACSRRGWHLNRVGFRRTLVRLKLLSSWLCPGICMFQTNSREVEAAAVMAPSLVAMTFQTNSREVEAPVCASRPRRTVGVSDELS